MADELTFHCPMCNANLPEESRGQVDPNLCGICEDPANREPRFTDGPWQAGHGESTGQGSRLAVFSAHGSTIAVCRPTDDHEKGLANARLIAAAPDLLEAILEAIRVGVLDVTKHDNNTEEDNVTIDRVWAALGKAL